VALYQETPVPRFLSFPGDKRHIDRPGQPDRHHHRLAVIVLLVALARAWWTPWFFVILMVGSFLGAIFLSFLYMVVALPLAEWISGPGVTDTNAWRIFHMVISNLILLFVPMGLLFGAVGFVLVSLLRLFRAIRRKRDTDAT
jgi:hypothetical protein